MLWLRVVVILLLFSLSLQKGKSDRKRKQEEANVEIEKQSTEKEKEAPLSHPSSSVTKQSILKNHDNVDYSPRKFENPVLVYVTPWNNKGYDLAKWVSHKLTHVSPVWIQLKPQTADKSFSCRILGTHDIDHGWMEEVRKNNSYVKIVPRVLFDDWSPDHINQFIQHEAWMNRCLGDLINLLTRSHFDGAVIEFWSKVMIHTRGEAVNLLVEMMNSWGSTFHKRNMQFILAVGPALNPKNQITGMLTTSHLYALAENVDYIQMMTYDFPSTTPSGVAPYGWVEQNVNSLLDRAPPDLAIHLMLGLNHYGYEYTSDGMQAVNFDQYLKKLRQADNKLEWDANAKEHVLVTFDSKIYYPSLTSVEMRLNIARKYGIGVGIWDFGQGLNYFTQLL